MFYILLCIWNIYGMLLLLNYVMAQPISIYGAAAEAKNEQL
jgi:hypothetical protein